MVTVATARLSGDAAKLVLGDFVFAGGEALVHLPLYLLQAAVGHQQLLQLIERRLSLLPRLDGNVNFSFCREH